MFLSFISVQFSSSFDLEGPLLKRQSEDGEVGPLSAVQSALGTPRLWLRLASHHFDSTIHRRSITETTEVTALVYMGSSSDVFLQAAPPVWSSVISHRVNVMWPTIPGNVNAHCITYESDAMASLVSWPAHRLKFNSDLLYLHCICFTCITVYLFDFAWCCVRTFTALYVAYRRRLHLNLTPGG